MRRVSVTLENGRAYVVTFVNAAATRVECIVEVQPNARQQRHGRIGDGQRYRATWNGDGEPSATAKRAITEASSRVPA